MRTNKCMKMNDSGKNVYEINLVSYSDQQMLPKLDRIAYAEKNNLKKGLKFRMKLGRRKCYESGKQKDMIPG